MERQEITPAPLMKMVQGSWVAKAIAVATELEVFTLLNKNGPLTLEEAAERLNIDTRPTEMLLNACVSLELLAKQDGKYLNTPVTDKFLVKGMPSYFGDMIIHLGVERYEAFSNLKQAVLRNEPVCFGIDDLATNPERAKEFTRAMHNNSIGPGIALSNLIDFSKFRLLLDLGGGSGGCAIMITKKYPNLKAIVFDYAPVCEVADECIERMSTSSNVTTCSGDYWTDELPEGADVVLLGNILHHYDEDKNEILLQKIYDYLPKAGMVIIVDFLLDDNKTGPVTSTLFALNMLLSQKGRTYSGKEVSEMRQDLGFVDVKSQISLAGPQSVVYGIKQ
jgi:SAM-dependent methyltransferase